MIYRKEIDGLRAVAVLPVIFYHAGFTLFKGGYVGVDIFFVISGYLITSIIYGELAAGKFSIVNFYERRARRIIPALFLILIVSLPFAWIWLTPREMKSYSESLLAVSVFVSNIFFEKNSGYFDTASELKPLIHTWSLAVEEQYYLTFPIFLALVYRLGRRWLLILVAAVCVASLALAQTIVAAQPMAAFFLLPSRAWELLLGSLVAVYFFDYEDRSLSPNMCRFGSAIGLLLILYSMLIFDSHTPFPSIYALVPTLGTALVLLCARETNFVGWILSNRFFVFIGLISYSAYLWHQPIFAFFRQSGFGSGTNENVFFYLSLVSLLLAYLSWKYVETPFRNKASFSRSQIFIITLSGILLFTAVGAVGHLTKGFESRITPDRAEFLRYFENATPQMKYFELTGVLDSYRYQCDFYDMEKFREGHWSKLPVEKIADECYVRSSAVPHAVMIWGDSHAMQYYAGLKDTLPEDWQILQVASSGCKAQLGARENRKDYCEYSNWFAMQTIREAKPEVVLVAQIGPQTVENMKQIGDALLANGVQKVVFAGQAPSWMNVLPYIVAHRLWEHTPVRTNIGVNKDVLAHDKDLKKQFPSSPALRFVSVIDSLCNAEGCLVYLDGDKKTGITSWDFCHLTHVASRHVAEDVLAKEILGGF